MEKSVQSEIYSHWNYFRKLKMAELR